MTDFTIIATLSFCANFCFVRRSVVGIIACIALAAVIGVSHV